MNAVSGPKFCGQRDDFENIEDHLSGNHEVTFSDRYSKASKGHENYGDKSNL